MQYLKPIEIDCPDGYIPLAQPRSFVNRSGGANPSVQITHPVKPDSNEHAISIITSCISESDEIRNICLMAMSKLRSNTFIIGLSDRVIPIINSSLQQMEYGRPWHASLELKDIFVFQKLPMKPLPS